MKTTKYFLIAATALTLGACSNDNELIADGNPVAAEVYAGIGAVQSRAAGTAWDANDSIGISGISGSTTYENVRYQTTGDGTFTHAGGDATGIFFESTDPVTFTAYYPFYGTEGVSPATISDVTTENQKDQKKFDFLFATASASRKDPILSFTGENAFKHKMTRLIINIKTDPNSGFDAEHVAGGQYSISGIRHSGTFNTVNGTATATGDADADWNITAEAADNNNVRTYDMILYPQTDASLTFKANIAGQKYVSPAITPALTAGTSYTYTITVKKTGLEVSSCTIDDWKPGTGGDIDAGMELPPPIGDKTAEQAILGDFYFSDGSFAGYETNLTEEQRNACIGVVFYTKQHDSDISDYSTSGIRQKKCHGYVVALNDVIYDANCKWGDIGIELGLYPTDSEGNAQNCLITPDIDWSGYCYTKKIIMAAGGKDKLTADTQEGYPATYYAVVDYTAKVPAPSNSSGWFLPAIGQIWLVYNQRDNLRFENAGGSNFLAKHYWSSSENTRTNTSAKWGCLAVDCINGVVEWRNKNFRDGRVRPVLAY